ncbi:membrane protein [Microbacterium phage McGalleon]|uniref:Membrane protein n=1 Tax=Microbacterium phage McGalleon TaxID=2590936 RepID=A0A516KQY2_9CAUD|nr:membrane protein [Microbacterium phage McGalleon]QDP44102.1 membrane protein [Microbacterium phage McGalleon]
MTFWDVAWSALAWLWWAIVLLGAIILLFAIIVGIVRAVRGVIKAPSAIRKKEIARDAHRMAEVLYGAGTGYTYPLEQQGAFNAGVTWTLSEIERKPS